MFFCTMLADIVVELLNFVTKLSYSITVIELGFWTEMGWPVLNCIVHQCDRNKGKYYVTGKYGHKS